MRLRGHLAGPLSCIIFAMLLLLFGMFQMSFARHPAMQGLVLFVWGTALLILLGIFLDRRVLTHVRRIRSELWTVVESPDHPQAWNDQDPDNIVGLMHDALAVIKKIQHIQEDMHGKETSFRRIIDNAPLGILEVDAHGQIVDVNPMLLAMFGSPDEADLRERNIFTTSILAESGLAADVQACLTSGKAALSERMYPSSWGKNVYLRAHITPLKDDAQALVGVQAIIEDITERVLMEHALKNRETEYRSLFKNMQSGLAYQKMLFDECDRAVDYIFLDVNEAFERLSGLRSIVGRRATDVVPDLPDIEPDLLAIYGKVAATGEETTFESFFTPIGMWFSIDVYSPEPGYCVTVYNNITERKWAEESLHKLNEDLEHRVDARTLELQNINRFLEESLSALEKAQKQLVESEKMAVLGGLVAGVTHEVSTPLGIGVTAASHLEQKTRDIRNLFEHQRMTRSDLEAYLETAEESTQMILANLTRAAENIQSFKQVAVDQTHDARRQFQLKHCIDNVLLSLRPKLKRTPYTITVDCPDTIELDSYPGAFSQILTNFIMNALLHGFDGRAEGHMVILARLLREDLQLTFTDDGTGMNAEQLSHIFEPFFTTKRQQGGTGLGLHIVYNLVTQTLRGQIECESVPGSGTTFLLTIPVVQEGDTNHE